MHNPTRKSLAKFGQFLPALALLLVIAAVIGIALAVYQRAQASNRSALQVFYLSLPEDNMLQLMDENFNTPTSPVRSVTSIAIGTNGTLVYYDQWEDGGYDADIANPYGNYYDATSNPDGTQIWGDGVLANGCPPSINNVANPCTDPSDDLLGKGDVITLDEQVIVNGTLNNYSRNPAQIFYDGRDKVGATLPVAITRSVWPDGVGSLVADAVSVLPTERWGTYFESPVGENLEPTDSEGFEDVRWLIMAGPGGAQIALDTNGDGTTDINLNLAEGERSLVGDIQSGATLTSDNPVQVNLLTADNASTYENRFYNLIPYADWDSEYYSPIGTPDGGAQCTSVWVYNPGSSPLTVDYTFGDGTTGSIVDIPSGGALPSEHIPDGYGAYFYTSGSVFLPVSTTDCSTSGGDIYDWGNELYPLKQLSPEILIGWTPGCTDESSLGVCLNVDGVPANTKSRSVVWVTPLGDTTLYVDTDGSGISCEPTVTGAEQAISANALEAVRITDDPFNVRDQFDTQAYTNNGGGNYNANWASDWVETGDGTGVPTGGSIWITGNTLQFRDNGATNFDDNIRRSVNLDGMGFARLSFRSTLAGLSTGNDNVVVEVSPTGGDPWTILTTYTANGGPTTEVFDLSAYATANTAIRFRNAQEWEGGETWTIDNVNIDYSVGDGITGDFDMTGTYIRTCDDTLIAAAFGQYPGLSGSGDDEAMDLGMGIPPYGSQIRLEKFASDSFVSPGDEVTYTYEVSLIQTFSTQVNNVEVVDDFCAPAVYASGDSAPLTFLDPGETWIFTCTTRLYAETTNTAMAYALYGTDRIRSAPDQATVELTSSLGDYVWVDEDGDGDQDAGEEGIPNVRLTLTGVDMEGNPVSLETITDSNGRYLFTDVPPSNASGYTITVDTDTLVDGLEANPTYDENGVGTPHTTSVVLGSDLEYTTADFGYNWSSTSETNTPTGGSTGMIGDRLWIDADGDGLQDANEAGLAGASVQLITSGPDGLFGTADDVVAATTTTDAAGNYAFDGLAAGAYVIRVPSPPSGYTQTGDPDGNLDNQTTAPIVLAPGDVYLNADFGYRLDSGGNTLGNLIFLDSNGDGNWDTGEPGLPGVSVALLDSSGNVIATAITDVNGQYSFLGLPDGTYTVWVNDAANILGELSQNSTPDNNNDGGQSCGTCNGRNTVSVSGGAGNTYQDFGYAPAGHGSGEGLIGDTLWLDTNGNNTYDPGEGLEGVIINLLDASGDVISRAVTNENGQYFFGGLPAGDYTVDINTTTLPNYGIDLENFVDPDGGLPGQASLTLAAGEIDLAQDFGYRFPTDPNTISGTIWEDTNADGALSGESGRFAGVTVALYDADGDLVATTVTDANGDFSFAGLPDGTYTVDVTDEANLLNGYWHSLGGTPGADNNSQSDPYTVTVSNGETNASADFGYYLDPASIGNLVWNDTDFDDLQDVGELGIPNVQVILTITWPNGAGTTTLTTLTDANGNYSFENLLQDEDFNGAGDGEPTFTVAFTAPSGYTPVTADVGSDDTIDSDGASATATVTQGEYNDTVDSGFKQVVFIGDRLWYDWDGDGVQDANEPGISGVQVFLDLNTNGVYDEGIDLLDTTDSNGLYGFDNQPAGTYSVVVRASTLPGGVSQTGDPDVTLDNQHTVAASTTGTYDYVDFGYQGTGSISDFVWNDLDGDGVQDAGEAGIGGVTVWVDLDNDGVQDENEPSDVTDANGKYAIGNLPAGTLIVRTSGAPISGATPTYDPDGAGTPNVASVVLGAGEDREDVDFGYQFASLSISKSSSAGGTVNPGDTIQYTIVVRNNTASPQTGIAITDALPDGTDYVASSTVATGYTSGAAMIEDTFPTAGDGETGSGWTGGWVEIGESDGFALEDIQVLATGLRIQDNDNGGEGAYRQVDLSGYSSAWLSLNYTNYGLNDADEDVTLDVSTDGGFSWTNLYTWDGPIANGSGSLLVDISAYIDTDTRIRFLGSAGLGGGSGLIVDNVWIGALIAQDSFPTVGNGTTGSGWTGGWVEIGESDGFALEDIQVLATGLRIQDNDNGGEGAYREVDLSGYSSVWLNLDYTNYGLSDADEDVTLDVSTDGGSSWTNLYTWDGILADGSGSLQVDISAYIDTDTRLRFLGSAGLGYASGLIVDNIRIIGNQPDVAVTLDNLSGGANPDLVDGIPQDLVEAGDNFVLDPGQTMQVTFQVTVDDPVALSSIDNTASVVSVQNPTPQEDSTQDDLPLANLGDFVWNDLDGNGQQDSGEPGIPGIPIYLYDPGPDGVIGGGDDVLAASTTTGVGGAYAFSNLEPGDYYLVFAPSIEEYIFTTPDSGGDTTDSDADPDTGQTAIFTAYAGVTKEDLDAGLQEAKFDYGDLPPSYNLTLKADDGARHVIQNNNQVYLGAALPDTEADGQENAYTVGDDLDGNDDDDGVIWTDSVLWKYGTAAGGNGGSIDVTVTCPTGTCYLAAWFDFNNDADFADTGEQVFLDQAMTTGTTTLTFDIPIPTGKNAGDNVTGVINTRFRLYRNSTSGAASLTGNVANGEVEDHQFQVDNGVTTPVTLSYFRSWKGGGADSDFIFFEWSTATETGNVGFNLYVATDQGRILLNADPIPSHVIDSLARQDYSYRAANVPGKTFFIEDLSILGETQLRGPFHLGRSYGSRAKEQPVDWKTIQTESEQKDLQDSLNWRWRIYIPIELTVRQTGLYRVTYEDLREAGMNLNNVPIGYIAITNQGQPVPIRVISRARFGPGSYIEFYGQAVDTLYSDANVYILQVNRDLALRIPVDTTKIDSKASLASYYLETVTVENQRNYSFALAGDPWFDTSMLVYKAAKSWSFNLEAPGYIAGAAPATLSVDLWGVTDWLDADPDHHLQVAFNNALLADQYFNGLVQLPLQLELPGELLQSGANTLQFTLPADTGVKYDLIYLDGYKITYPRAFVAQEGKLIFTAAGARFRVDNLPSKAVVVYRLDAAGLTRLGRVNIKPATDGTFSATFMGNQQEATYLVATEEAILFPQIELGRPKQNITSGEAELLIISHPNFIEGLAPLTAARQAQGYTVKVVDVNDIYAQFGNAVLDPQPIQDYIRFAAANLGTRFVLLVGGDTYDYRNYLGQGSFSFIPSFYTATDDRIVKYAPADPLFTDLDGDGLPDLPIGRFPVRTEAELQALIAKTLAYQEKDYSQTAVFSADKLDGSLSFTAISMGFEAQLPEGWSVQQAYIDQVGTSIARTNLIHALNQGAALTSFVGHSGPTQWTYSGLFNANNAAALTNTGRPTVVVQWGCWNTYYVSPSYNTLAHRFLLSGEQGAAAVLGATTLTQIHSEELLGRILMPYLVQPGMTIGEAVQLAKAELALTHPELLDVLLGWSLLGDPTLAISP